MRALPLALIGLVALVPGGVGCGGAAVRRSAESASELPENVARLRWRTSIHEHGMFEPRPEECARGAVIGSRLVIGSRAGRLVALGTGDGRVVWSTPVSGGIDAEARFDERRGQVYFGSDDGNFYATAPDGAVRWSYKSKGAIERLPEVDSELVYFTTANDRVVALEAATGKWRWQYEREPPEGFTIHGHSGPRLHQGSVYVGFSDGFLVALQAATGQVLWAHSLAAGTDQFVDVDATPALFADVVIASSYSGGLYALAERNGEVRWRRGIEGASALRIDGGRLYVAAPREGLAALTPDGQVLWRQGLTDAGDLTPPQAVGPYLVFSGSRGGLFIVDRTSGRLLQLFNPGHGACAAATPGPDPHDLYLLANSGTVYALRLVW
jgi:outer membrane protein assembly factor BamB